MLEEKTIRKAIKGNDKAFLKLINDSKEQIYRTAFAYVKEEDMALEIVQEVVYRAYKSIKKLKEPKYFNTWIIRIAINVSTDFYNKKIKIVYMEHEKVLEKVEPVHNEEDDRLYLMESLDKLQEKYKKVVILKYFDDLTFKEIAEVLEIPESTVKTNLYKAISILRDHMKVEVI